MTMLTRIPENVPTSQFTQTPPEQHFSLTIPFLTTLQSSLKGLKSGQFWFKSQQRQEPSSLSPCPDKLWGLASSN